MYQNGSKRGIQLHRYISKLSEGGLEAKAEKRGMMKMKNRITMKKLRAWNYATGATNETVEVTLPNGENVYITYKDCGYDVQRKDVIEVSQHMSKDCQYDNTMFRASNAEVEEYTLKDINIDVITIKRD